jgi:hypothetical protein
MCVGGKCLKCSSGARIGDAYQVRRSAWLGMKLPGVRSVQCMSNYEGLTSCGTRGSVVMAREDTMLREAIVLTCAASSMGACLFSVHDG